ncbi:MAG: CHAD domain-containing protein [Nitrospirae bacterium]|nr:CHAD domain-containing protein [Nitrospirota bacterium]
MMKTRPSHPDRLLTSYQLVRAALTDMASGHLRRKTLHRLRIHLRRLQAMYELMGEEPTARLLSQCVSRFSKIRTLQVFQQYLARLPARHSDRRTVARLITKRRRELETDDVYRKIRRIVRQHARPPIPASARWLPDRLAARRVTQVARLRGEAVAAAADPRRRTLHALRLSIKSLRYQEECGFGHQSAAPHLARLLKQAQDTLGAYEDRAPFRKLAQRLDLKSLKMIERDFRQARKQARALPGLLTLQLQHVESPSLHTITPASTPKAAAVC